MPNVNYGKNYILAQLRKFVEDENNPSGERLRALELMCKLYKLLGERKLKKPTALKPKNLPSVDSLVQELESETR